MNKQHMFDRMLKNKMRPVGGMTSRKLNEDKGQAA